MLDTGIFSSCAMLLVRECFNSLAAFSDALRRPFSYLRNNVAHPGRNHHLRCEYRNDCYGPNCGPRYVRRRQHHIHDNHILSIRRYRSISRPVCAVLQTKNEIVNMAALAMRNFNLSLGWLNNEIVAFVQPVRKARTRRKGPYLPFRDFPYRENIEFR